ncbi:MAG: hypothetical protein LBJ89_04920 [Holosporales bacterium]|jgi:tyrosine-specific transport protein|nr:hypothetical protein [Holosporales bacterium]
MDMVSVNRFLSTVFLISGTAIGAGVIALPLAAANLNFIQVAVFIVIGFFVAYYSSCMAVRLSQHVGKGTGIAELSKQLGGKFTFTLSIVTFYILSLALLSAYFAGLTDTLGSFFNIPSTYVTLLCGVGLMLMLLLNVRLFDRLNAILFLILIASLVFITFSVSKFNANYFDMSLKNRGLACFLPIVFTSFGVQNVCAHVCNYLELDIKKIQSAFKIGIIIPALIYFAWIVTVIVSIQSSDVEFFERMKNQQVGVGELVSFLCGNTTYPITGTIFKLLTFSAMATSAIGIGIGLLDSIRETYIPEKRLALSLVVLIPVIVAIFYPSTFVQILSFGAMIATFWVIFIPYYLLQKIDKKSAYSLKHILCLLFGIAVFVCEFLG